MKRPDVVTLLNSLTTGVSIEAGVPFAGLCKEKLTFKMTKKNTEKLVYQFDVLFFDIRIATVAAKVDQNENLIWAKV